MFDITKLISSIRVRYNKVVLINSFIITEFDFLSKTGSLSPWMESILLLKGAKHVTSFDYNKIISKHPDVETLLPNELSDKYFNGQRYDVMATYSSLEHSGLGRYANQTVSFKRCQKNLTSQAISKSTVLH